MFYVIMRVSLQWPQTKVYLSVTEENNHPPFVDFDKKYHLIQLDHILDQVNSCVSSPASIDLQHQPGVSAVTLSSRRAAVCPIRDSSITHTLPDSRRCRAARLNWFMFPAAFVHLCSTLRSTLQSGLRMQCMMGYLLVGIVSDRREGCAGLLQVLIFSANWDV